MDISVGKGTKNAPWFCGTSLGHGFLSVADEFSWISWAVLIPDLDI
jgi:hypothetical protein